MTLVRIASVRPLHDFVVELTLTTGEVVRRDLDKLLAGPVFDALRKDPARFQQVGIENGTLAWPGGIDLCPDTVIWDGLPPKDSAIRAA